MSLYSHMSWHSSLLLVACVLLWFSTRHVTLDVRLDVEVTGMLGSRLGLQMICKGENNGCYVLCGRNYCESYVWPLSVT